MPPSWDQDAQLEEAQFEEMLERRQAVDELGPGPVEEAAEGIAWWAFWNSCLVPMTMLTVTLAAVVWALFLLH